MAAWTQRRGRETREGSIKQERAHLTLSRVQMWENIINPPEALYRSEIWEIHPFSCWLGSAALVLLVYHVCVFHYFFPWLD